MTRRIRATRARVHSPQQLWDARLAADPDRIASEQLKAACGEACGTDLLTTIHSIDAATHVWERNDEHFTFPIPGMLMKYWKAGPVPAYLEENRKNYEVGWKAAQHALLVSSPIGKDYAEYWVKRMQFSVNYIEAIQLVRQAAGAEAAHQSEQAARNATAALTTLRESIDAYASVARNQTDRGAIAVAVEYGYRPLEKKVAELKRLQTME